MYLPPDFYEARLAVERRDAECFAVADQQGQPVRTAGSGGFRSLADVTADGEVAPSPDLRIPDKLPHSGQQIRETMAGSLLVEEVGSIAVSSGGTYSAGRASTKCLDQAS